LRTFSTCPFTRPDFWLASERLRLVARLPPEDLRAPLAERLDWLRRLLDAGFERDLALGDLALEPFALEPLRDEPERAFERLLRLDDPRLPAELFFCPDLDVPWAIVASLIGSSGGLGCFAPV
jgi:hypothetical protein